MRCRNNRENGRGPEAQKILEIRKRPNRPLSAERDQRLDTVAKDRDRNFWMSAQEALNYGLIVRMVTSAGELDRA